MSLRLLPLLLLISLSLYYLPFITPGPLPSAPDLIPSRFDRSTPLETITPSYIQRSGLKERPSRRSASVCSQNCSWETYVPNSEFVTKVDHRSVFAIDDTDRLKAMNETMACAPRQFGYSVEAGEAIFPPYFYPDCSALIVDPQPVLSIDHTSGTFTMLCPNGVNGTYMLNPTDLLRTGQYYIYELGWKTKTYPGRPVQLDGSEFVYASCGGNFTQAQFVPIKNEEADVRAKGVMAEKGMKQKPLAVLFISVDSFSRRHFFRKLTKTVEKLNAMNSGKSGYSVFDFKLHNILGASSTENMVPMFGNSSWVELDDPPFEDLLGDGALWNIFKANGYVTMLGFENCDYHFPEALGKFVHVDHLVRNFYCAAAKFLKVNMSKDGKVQRCIGNHMSHYYVLNYTQAFSQMYEEANQFIYLHLNAAHEESGQHAVTLDLDIEQFLLSYLPAIQRTHDLAFFLQGDHGMRYGNWKKDMAAKQENKLPALFLIANDGLLQRIPNSYDALWHNTVRLVSKRDLRATILGLVEMPYDKVYPVHSESYLARDVDLTREKVTDTRDCEEIDIPPWHCSCADLKEIDPSVYLNNTDPELNRLLTTVAEETVLMINKQVNLPLRLKQGLCQRLTFRTILQAYGLKLGPKMEQIQLEFGVHENPNAIFEVFAILGTENKNRFMVLERKKQPIVPITYRGFQARLRVLPTQLINVQRKDKYRGPCEVLSRANGLPGDLCICHDLEQVRASFPSLFEEDS